MGVAIGVAATVAEGGAEDRAGGGVDGEAVSVLEVEQPTANIAIATTNSRRPLTRAF